MKARNTLLAIVLLITGSLSQVAFADKDISSLNGQLVKVGDHNKYRYSYRKFNLATNPFSMIGGTYGISGSYAINSNIALRADFNYSDGMGDSLSGIETSLTAPIYFRKVYDDWFIEPGFLLKRTKFEGEKFESATGPIVFLGHHWMFDSGLNFAWGYGFGRNWSYDPKDENEAMINSQTFGSGYLRFGYAF